MVPEHIEANHESWSVGAGRSGSVERFMDLGALFTLEPHGPDTFVGAGPRYPWGGLYGGQIVAQALRAAAATVDSELAVHSLRAYFIRRGDASEPVRYEVDRIRNGRSFSTRRVVARQAIGAILNLEASFQRPETDFSLQTVHMPADVPPPGAPDRDNWTTSFDRYEVPSGQLSRPAVGAGRTAAWMRVTDDLAEEPLVHQCWLAYMSDDLPSETVRQALLEHEPPGTDHDTWWQGGFGASLDHSIWFHHAVRADQWHLYDFACHGYVGGRGLSVGHVFSADGLHVATVTQEVLVRTKRTHPSA